MRTRLLLVVAATLAGGCMEGFRKPLQTPPDYVLTDEFHKAEDHLDVGERREAERIYGFLESRPAPHGYTLIARVRLAEIAYERGEVEEAEERLREIVRGADSFPVPDREALARAHLLLGRILYDRGHWADARMHFEQYIAQLPGAPETTELLILIAKIHDRRGELMDALRSYDRALDWSTDPVQIGDVKRQIRSLVDDGTSLRDLQEILLLYEGRYAGNRAQLRLAELEARDGSGGASSRRLRDLLGHGDGAVASDAEEILRSLRGTGTADPGTVGVLLPLTGKYSRFGRLALDGILAASGVFDPEDTSPPVRWLVRDTRGDPAEAASLVHVLTEVHKVVAIVGPLVGSAAEAAAREANAVGVPLITVARKSELEGIGEFVYRSSLTDANMTRSLARIAAEETGISRFAVLYPEGAYGEEIRARFERAVEAQGGVVVAQEPYDPGSADFGEPIKNLIHAAPEDVYREGEDLRVGFDALFLPGSLRTLKLLLPQIAYYDLVGVQLLGTNVFNSPKLLEEAGDFVQGALFVDGFLPSGASPGNRAFVDRFFLDFGREPGLVEALAFEVAELLERRLEEDRVTSRLDLVRSLMRLEPRAGVVGLRGFDTAGEAVRDLKVLTVAGPEILELSWPHRGIDEVGTGLGATDGFGVTSIALEPEPAPAIPPLPDEAPRPR